MFLDVGVWCGVVKLLARLPAMPSDLKLGTKKQHRWGKTASSSFLEKDSQIFKNKNIFFSRKIFLDFWLFDTDSFAAPQISLCRWMLRSTPGLLLLWHWQSDAVTTRIDFFQRKFLDIKKYISGLDCEMGGWGGWPLHCSVPGGAGWSNSPLRGNLFPTYK